MSELTIPTHLAIIMDGNRRWAKKRGLPTQLGHSEGATTLEKVADGQANKVFIPFDATKTLASVSALFDAKQ